MTNEKGFAAYTALKSVADDLVMDALLPADGGSAVVAPISRRRPVYEFFSHGWGVAVICALVAIVVMGGIIWAGQQPDIETPPVGMPISPGETKKETPETEQMPAPDEPMENESETDVPDTQESEKNAVVLHGLERKYIPPKFLCNSTTLTEGEDGLQHGETADGLGFEGVMQSGETPLLPTVIWVKDGISDYLDVAEGYTVKEFKVYDMDMQLVESGSAVQGLDSEESVNRFIIKKLPVGKWYMSLRVAHDGGEMHHCVYEYAFVAKVAETVTDTCTVRTDQDRYAWGERLLDGERWGHLMPTLISTTAGAILDIQTEAWELVNLDTGERAKVTRGFTVPEDWMEEWRYPTASDDLVQLNISLMIDWTTTPPGRYRLTYMGTEPAQGEAYPYCDFEIYLPDQRMAVWGNDQYVIPMEAMLWTEEWDEASKTMIRTEGKGHANIEQYDSEVPLLEELIATDIQIVGADICRYVVYTHWGFDVLYDGSDWEEAVEGLSVGDGRYVVFTVYRQGEYIPEADAYEGSMYEYAFRLEIWGKT